MDFLKKDQCLKVDVCCGLAWGDEAKGKIVSHLASCGGYDFVCRWAGGHNAGHTIYKNGHKYKTHLIPSGIFYNVPSIIGPDCVIEKKAFIEEIKYLNENGFDTSLIKISPKCHVVSEDHIIEDKKKYVGAQGSTAKGIAPCYRDKYARLGSRVEDAQNISFFKNYIWDEKLYGKILCEGAQGFWLDINYGNYPFVTSSNTLPYGACSLGFPMQCIDNVYGAAKIYDTRSGIDPDFPDSLLDDPELAKIGDVGKEYGVTTGRRRKVNWLNLDKLCTALLISGTTCCIISKIDVLCETGLFKLYYDGELHTFNSYETMREYIDNILFTCCPHLKRVIYSDDVEKVHDL
tara:strand:+ start:6090 stop:7130 length:1041 start_codon:yes stop_codon:yes gene_type:complete